MSNRTALVLTLLAGASPAFAQTSPDPTSGGDQPPAGQPTQPTPPTPPGYTTAAAPVPVQPAPMPEHHIGEIVRTKWAASLYGFVEADTIYDSTQGLFESVGNAAIPRPDTYVGDHPQLTYGARNSRVGFDLRAPDWGSIKSSGKIEIDFLGNEPGKPFDATGLVSEAAFFQNPVLRYRHAYVKLETPIVDFLFGQTWELFGWQSYFFPNTVEIQGVVGEVYSRTPQIRVSKTLKTDAGITIDAAVAALRSPDRASAVPDGQAGLKVAFDKLKAWHTGGATATSSDSAAIGVSVVGRQYSATAFSAKPQSEVTTDGYGIAVDALVPLNPGTKNHHANALTLTGEFVSGAGIADVYTGLNFGVAEPALPNPGKLNPAPAYTPNIDPGLAMYNAVGQLLAVKVQSYNVGLQWYPFDQNRFFISGFYGDIQSTNAIDFGAHTKNWKEDAYYTASLFFDVTPAVRLGLEQDLYNMTFNDNTQAKNYRTQFSAFYIF